MIIEELDEDTARRAVPALGDILQACVAAGASVNFIEPFTAADAQAWWRATVLPALARGERRLLVAREDGTLLGTAQLVIIGIPNQCHRAEVSKMLVHPRARRRGVARALMHALEDVARAEGRSLLTLDTVSDSPAQRLYESVGYAIAGVIPRYARAAAAPRLDAATFMYKDLAPA